MKIKYLIFGDGLLGNAFKSIKGAAVLSKSQCDITNKDEIKDAVNQYRPHTVINCAGIVPKNSVSVEQVLKTNSFAPHYIADVCEGECNFIHVSTDCVFDGRRGKYTERDSPNATDVYGMSKIFGELRGTGLTIRTSFVGLPDPAGRGLLAWAREQSKIIGYDNVFWNGLTTIELVRQIVGLADQEIKGLRHVYSHTVSKYELLKYAVQIFGWDIMIVPESEHGNGIHTADHTLSSLYATGFVAKSTARQLKELADVQ